MKDSGCGLVHRAVNNYNASSVRFGGTQSLSLHENQIWVAIPTDGASTPSSLKLNYAAQGSPLCARHRARIDKPRKTSRHLALARAEVNR